MTPKTAEELRQRVEYIMADFHIPVHERERIKLVVSDYAEALARERVLVAIDELMGEGWLDFVESIPPKRRSIFHTNAMRVRARTLEGKSC